MNIKIIGSVVLTGLFMAACSQTQIEEPAAVAAKPAADANRHTHPANKCTNSVTHSHPNGKRPHTHHYSCQSNAKKKPNQHRHPANRCTKSIYHSHPNGNRPHTHRYSCQSKGMNRNPNAHTHPANSMTRSVRHTHPNGNRPHTHHYGR